MSVAGVAVKLITAFIAGIVSVLAFAPFKFSLLIFIALGLLFKLWLDAKTAKTAFLTGWCFGLGQFGVGVSWMYISLNTFGNMSSFLAGLTVLILIMGLALFPASVGLLQHVFKSSPVSIRLLAVISPLWVLAEWVREWLFTGLPWLSAGYSQIDNFLSGWAPLGGVYSVSLAVVLIASSIVLATFKRIKSSLFCLSLFIIISYLVSLQSWTEKSDQSLVVKLVQGNVSIFDKWNPSKTDEILNQYIELSQAGKKADLIIWPEAAAPVLLTQLPKAFWQALKARPNSQYMFGVLENDVQSRKLYNSVIATKENGSLGYYRKIHLVPFGEYLPLKPALEWFLDYLKIPMSDLSPYRDKQKLITINGIKIGVSICYEDAFANVIRKDLPESGVLINLSEDAWFGNSLAPHQRLQMAQMRAIENGRAMIRVSNNGLSSIINFKGEIQAVTPQFKAHFLDGKVGVRTGATPFSLIGHKLVISTTLGLIAISFLFKIFRTNKKDYKPDRVIKFG